MSTTQTNLLVETEPTKDFFISMLVRDIQLIPAIVDLVDNSVDGAMRLRPAGDFNGLAVRLTVDSTQFKVADNCGGIPINIARDYAFRFGRAAGMQATPHSIGQFGVGMKRALFKLGGEFEVHSSTTSDGFVLKVDVEEWRQSPDWHFTLESVSETGVDLDEAGTTIEVRQLHDQVRRDFERQQFLNDLTEEIADRHQESMAKGLAISVNTVPINNDPAELLESDRLKPAYDEISLNGGAPVTIKMYAGIGESSPREGGWYVFCNGRLVLGADQTLTTGWGEDGGKTLPRYHNQFARFRGYVFFECDDASRLPWTTTKTGVDANSDVYRQARTRMIKLMRPVIDFLNLLDREKDSPPAGQELLEDIVAETKGTPIAALTTTSRFSAPPRVKAPKAPETQTIQYSVEKAKADRAKKVLRATSLRAVGIKTFEYFYKLECEEDD